VVGISAKAQGNWNWRGAGERAQPGGVGAFIRDRRRAAGLTQVQLAEAAAVSVGMLRDLEQDRTARPRRAALQELYTALGLGPAPAGPGTGYGAEPGHTPGSGPRDGRAEQVVTGAGAGVRLCILGPLWASRGGLPVQLGGARQRAVLGLLALHPNAVLHRDTIIEALWRDDSPPSAVKMVQAHIGRLRRQLDPGRQPQDRDGVLLSAGTYYRLQADATQLDLIAFGQLADRGRAVRQAGDAATACALYAEALSLWQGDPLADLDLLAGHPALFGLSRRRAAVVSDFAETATGAGWHDRVLPYLEALAERDPLDERVHGWLMIALAGTGQQAAALACYDSLRRRLAGKLGVLPGPVLAGAHARVLRQDVPVARTFPPGRPVTLPHRAALDRAELPPSCRRGRVPRKPPRPRQP
jgi:DNA-binding SARP family transcriptional activator/transcriptional regulator with XRE-family HTH domain